MRHYSKNYNSPESRRKRSERARYAVSCRADRQPENRAPRIAQREDLFEIVVRNKISGNETLIEINRGTRANNFRFIVGGKLWKICGMARAEGLILRSLSVAVRKVKGGL